MICVRRETTFKNIRRAIIIGLLGFQWHNLVNMRFIYTKEFLDQSYTKCCQNSPQHVLSRPRNVGFITVTFADLYISFVRLQ